MLEIALEITLCLLIAALIGFILGFIVAKATTKKVSTPKDITEENLHEEIETQPSIPTEKAVEILTVLDETKETMSQKPELLDAPRDNSKDTLTQIKGIGPKVEDQLNKAGIYHFEQIANWNEENIQWLEDHTTFAHRAKKDLWINQAKALI